MPKPFPIPLHLGIDICSLQRINAVVRSHPTRFIARLLSHVERDAYKNILQPYSPPATHPPDLADEPIPEKNNAVEHPKKIQFLAGRWAAKEAIIKACSMAGRKRVGWKDIMILPHGYGQGGVIEMVPQAVVLAEVEGEKGQDWKKRWEGGEEVRISISHDGGLATAVAMKYGAVAREGMGTSGSKGESEPKAFENMRAVPRNRSKITDEKSTLELGQMTSHGGIALSSSSPLGEGIHKLKNRRKTLRAYLKKELARLQSSPSTVYLLQYHPSLVSNYQELNIESLMRDFQQHPLSDSDEALDIKRIAEELIAQREEPSLNGEDGKAFVGWLEGRVDARSEVLAEWARELSGVLGGRNIEGEVDTSVEKHFDASKEEITSGNLEDEGQANSHADMQATQVDLQEDSRDENNDTIAKEHDELANQGLDEMPEPQVEVESEMEGLEILDTVMKEAEKKIHHKKRRIKYRTKKEPLQKELFDATQELEALMEARKSGQGTGKA